jgi:mono/diheme cytochrome c family protein
MNSSNPNALLLFVLLFSVVLTDAVPLAGRKQSADQKADKAEESQTKGDPVKGQLLFRSNCANCHNADSYEDKIGPGLKGLFKDPALREHRQPTEARIRNKIVKGSVMPAIGESFSEEELDDLIAYLRTL